MVNNHRRNKKFDRTRPRPQMILFSSFLKVGSGRTSTLQRYGTKNFELVGILERIQGFQEHLNRNANLSFRKRESFLVFFAKRKLEYFER